MALSDNTVLPLRNTAGMTQLNQVVKTSAVIYHHALACQNAAGTIVAAANSTTMTFMGLAVIDNPPVAGPGITGDGTRRVTMVSDVDVQISLKTSVTVGLVGAIMYAFDDAQATNLNTLGPEIGTLVEWTSANLGWIRLRGEQITKAS
jgi:hypothetical protein